MLKENKDTITNGIAVAMAIITVREQIRKIKAKHPFITEDEINKKIKMDKLAKQLDWIPKQLKTLKEKTSSQKKQSKKEIEIYNSLGIQLQKEMQKGLIRNHRQLTKRIKNEKIKRKVLQFIYGWNIHYYQEIERNYQQQTENSIAKYQSLLEEYGISKDQYQDEEVMKNTLAETKEMLEILTLLGIEDKTEIVNILKTSSKSYLDKIVSTINEGYFSKELVEQIPSILIEEQDFYGVFKENKESIEDKKINPMMLSKDEKTWLTSPKQLKTNLTILEEYQLLGSMSKTEQYAFLGKENLEETLDTILELGLEPLLEQGLDILNYDAKKWMRIRILKELEEIPPDSKAIINVLELEKDQFFIPEDIIENYIFSESPRLPETTTQEETVGEEESRKQLNSFQQTKRTYNIEGVILSKNKVERNLRNVVQEPISARDKIYLSLVDNTILQEQELQQIEKAIQSPVKKCKVVDNFKVL